MNETKVLVAGTGGQGVVVIGNILARAAVIENKNVVGMVAYGAEMRGGTAYAAIIISNEEIGSPIVDRPHIAIILNQPSLDKFEEDILPGGLALINTAMVAKPVKRLGLQRIEVAATQIAHDLGNVKVANIVAIGALIKHTNLLSMSSVEQGLTDLFTAKNPKLVPLNLKALHAGAEHSVYVPSSVPVDI
ncbi:MAG TPA: 2-oxoacid:acceptor oxidoreductase family protein [Anaerohalosphaeraceae bacterium]|nr:2-oxoacid:acceptor oxidoreductase family protein [Phycisphaerae bacterium]HOK94623.1 2-oxoacid:acceptor oxidoreductase family protein [Anaerohalosphaeraceae bacterium]HOM74953.1 2-oxoacid:acceptor oxidoreductase family protein [Anaerohalosphaeraceae bacterium]HPC63205.1 2-oxoacid:acceptor oxidoreductase family protein [Anaerohalosphaeraceae bacterium]HPO70986.1 2-oxoacid:acceptor oxidoreductase family protein [Anaerohalosphaeraceae bacterium]